MIKYRIPVRQDRSEAYGSFATTDRYSGLAPVMCIMQSELPYKMSFSIREDLRTVGLSMASTPNMFAVYDHLGLLPLEIIDD